MRDLPEELRGRPFTLAQAAAAGVPETSLRNSRLRRPWPGVRVPDELPDSLELRCRTLALIIPPEAVFSHETAAALQGLPLPVTRRPLDQAPTPPAALHVTLPDWATGYTRAVPRLRGVRGHYSLVSPSEVVRVDAISATGPSRTWADLASAGWALDDLVALADAVLNRLGGADASVLHRQVQAWAGRRGVTRLRTAAELAVPGVDSAMETRLRLLLARANLPRPLVNHDLVVDGAWLHRPDLSWPQWQVAVDYDGGHHFSSGPAQVRRDTARREDLLDAGWLLLVVTSDDLFLRPWYVVSRVARALRSRGAVV